MEKNRKEKLRSSFRILDIRNSEYNRLHLSLLLTFIAVALLSVLISKIPVINAGIVTSEEVFLDGSNFFFKWEYETHYNSYQNQWYNSLELVLASKGYIIFTILISVLLLLSGSCLLIRKFTQTKINIILYSVLFMIPIFIGIAKHIAFHQQNNYLSDNIGSFIYGLMLFPFCLNMPLQIILLRRKETFLEWVGLDFTELNDKVKHKSTLKIRKINFLVFLLIYLIVFTYPLLFTMQISLEPRLFLYLVILFFVVLFWLFFTFTLMNRYTVRRRMREFIAAILPLLVIFSFIIITSLAIPYFSFGERFFENLFLEVTFPEIFWSYLLKIAYGLLIGIIIGFFSQKKAKYIHLAIISVVILIFQYLFRPFYRFSYFSISEKAYFIIDPVIFTILITIGVFIGGLYASQYWIRYNIVDETREVV